MAKRNAQSGEPITIKKYANRRLYNTGSSSYITLEDLARMTREGADFVVVDAKSGTDITHSILTQIIMEEEASGTQMLPVSFLRDLIGMYGNSMQAMMPSYLEASMANFRANQSKIQDALRQGIGANPLAKIAETNIAMMKAMGEALLPKVPTAKPADISDDSDSTTKADTAELEALKAQMAAMQKKLDELDS